VTGSPAAHTHCHKILAWWEAVSPELASANGAVRRRNTIFEVQAVDHLAPLTPASSQPTAPPAVVAATSADDDDDGKKPHGGTAYCLNYHAVNIVPHCRRAQRLRFENPDVVTKQLAPQQRATGVFGEEVVRKHSPLLDRMSLGATTVDWVARLRMSLCTILI